MQQFNRYKKISQKYMDNNYIYDMPPLTNKDLRKLLIDMAFRYQASFTEEIKSMTDILNPEKTIKTVEKSQEWVELLTKKWQLERVFKDIDSEVIDVVMQKCNGNTIYCLHFFYHLMTEGYVEIDKHGIVIQRPSLIMLKKLQNFTRIPVPSFAIKGRLK